MVTIKTKHNVVNHNIIRLIFTKNKHCSELSSSRLSFAGDSLVSRPIPGDPVAIVSLVSCSFVGVLLGSVSLVSCSFVGVLLAGVSLVSCSFVGVLLISVSLVICYIPGVPFRFTDDFVCKEASDDNKGQLNGTVDTNGGTYKCYWKFY